MQEEGTADDHERFPRMTEADAERLHARQERLMSRIQARFEKERQQRLADILNEEFERIRREDEESGLADLPWVSATMFQPAAEADENSGDDDVPFDVLQLARETVDYGRYLMRTISARTLIPQGASPEHPLVQLATSTFRAGAKLADALGSYPPPPEIAAFTIVTLKRAHGHIEDARAALEDSADQGLIDEQWSAEIRLQLTRVSERTLAYIAELRSAS